MDSEAAAPTLPSAHAPSWLARERACYTYPQPTYITSNGRHNWPTACSLRAAPSPSPPPPPPAPAPAHPPAPVRLTAAALRFALAVEAGRLAPCVARDGRHLLLDLKRHLEEGRVDKGARLRTQRPAGSGRCRKP
eukprot:scaffold70910_cov69-Phaeocystis_antarctica.AAC.6